jgi:hypothetical protein
MNTEEIFQQVMNENCKDPLHRFAELVRQDEREQWDTSDMAHRSGGLTVDVTDLINRAIAAEREAIKRPWVGLTDEEIHKIIDDCTPNEAELEELNDFAKAIFAVEAKLKEKNT